MRARNYSSMSREERASAYIRPTKKKKRKKRKFAKAPNQRRPYEEYLASELWQKIRQKVLSRDKHICKCCGKTAIHVHHRNYNQETMDGRNLNGLISLCLKCHYSIHKDVNGNRHGVDSTETKLKELLGLEIRWNYQHEKQ